MKIGRGALLCGVLLMFAAPLVTADEVDDLLAGKPVRIDQDASPAAAEPAPPLEDPAVAPSETIPLESSPPTDEAFWDLTLEGHSKAKSAGDSPPDSEQKPAPATNINLVPEPSAIALAVLALLYFLIFFRRRHLA